MQRNDGNHTRSRAHRNPPCSPCLGWPAHSRGARAPVRTACALCLAQQGLPCHGREVPIGATEGCADRVHAALLSPAPRPGPDATLPVWDEQCLGTEGHIGEAPAQQPALELKHQQQLQKQRKQSWHLQRPRLQKRTKYQLRSGEATEVSKVTASTHSRR